MLNGVAATAQRPESGDLGLLFDQVRILGQHQQVFLVQKAHQTARVVSDGQSNQAGIDQRLHPNSKLTVGVDRGWRWAHQLAHRGTSCRLGHFDPPGLASPVAPTRGAGCQPTSVPALSWLSPTGGDSASGRVRPTGIRVTIGGLPSGGTGATAHPPGRRIDRSLSDQHIAAGEVVGMHDQVFLADPGTAL